VKLRTFLIRKYIERLNTRIREHDARRHEATDGGFKRHLGK